jgi:hypothetical protein
VATVEEESSTGSSSAHGEPLKCRVAAGKEHYLQVLALEGRVQQRAAKQVNKRSWKWGSFGVGGLCREAIAFNLWRELLLMAA